MAEDGIKKKNKAFHNNPTSNKKVVHNEVVKSDTAIAEDVNKVAIQDDSMEQNLLAEDKSDEIKAYDDKSSINESNDDKSNDNKSNDNKSKDKDKVKGNSKDKAKDTANDMARDKTKNIANDKSKANTDKVDDKAKEENNLSTVEEEPTDYRKKKKRIDLFKLLRIACILGFVIFSGLFTNEVFITPYRIKQSVELTRSLYNKPSITEAADPTKAPAVTEVVATTPVPITVIPTTIPDPSRDEQGRLLQFKELLARNEDVKGWITIPDSNIDYVVMQSGEEDPEFYLNRDFDKNELKAGSIFLDSKSSVELKTKNMTIHGHNMYSTDNMFHYLVYFKELDYYKARPVFTFDTIYDTGQWKIFSVFITNGTSKKEPLFDYTRAEFEDDSDFMNFIYDLRIRSMYNIDTVDVNEDDQILTLSTCSYEVKNYRTVIVARKLRDGEDPTVDVDSVTINEKPLYPWSYYYRYGGKEPKFTETFEEALLNGEINWYIPPSEQEQDSSQN